MIDTHFHTSVGPGACPPSVSGGKPVSQFEPRLPTLSLEASKPAILFVSSNDGSDMRIVKEVRSLSKVFNVHFFGIGVESDQSFVRQHSASFSLIPGTVRSLKSLVQLIALVIRARWKLKPIGIHVINEQLLAVTWPAYLGQYVVLDIFDSVFLRLNKPGNAWRLVKWLLYSRADRLIVTDTFRQDMLATWVKPRSVVIPNVPFKTEVSTITKVRKEALTLAYFGSLAEDRGTAFVRDLIESNPGFRVLCAGWPADSPSRQLFEDPTVNYLGVLTQEEANEIIAREADYIVAIYPDGNLNNFYASPNKLYDAIHTRTPLIIGDNVKISDFVEENKLGLVVDKALVSDPLVLGSVLIQKRGSFKMCSNLIDLYSWEKYEELLIGLHLRSS